MPYKIGPEATVIGAKGTPLEGQRAKRVNFTVDWGNPALGHSHEIVEVAADSDDNGIRQAIRAHIQAMRTKRSRPSFAARRERKREFEAHDAAVEED